MFNDTKVLLLLLAICCSAISAEELSENIKDSVEAKPDLDTSATSAKLFNLGGLFGQSPGYGYGYGTGYGNGYGSGSGYGSGYYPGYYRPSTYYPTYNSGSYPSTSSGYYPNTGTTYPNYGYSGYYPTTSSGFYPSTGYPSYGTNILGNGGYGGYGGNGGLREYYGYRNPENNSLHRNRGYGYFSDTDRYGLPRYGGYDSAGRYDGYGSRSGGYGVNGRYGGTGRYNSYDSGYGGYGDRDQYGYRGGSYRGYD